jgi:hypothetical protein
MADQTLSVREQLFLLAHDEYREFRPRIHLSALGIGLAGAALIDSSTCTGSVSPEPAP